jgi:hypothetical protein
MVAENLKSSDQSKPDNQSHDAIVLGMTQEEVDKETVKRIVSE